ncbi:MAG: V-type ATP synthase subunit E [Deltaproteobacteria bacterium]|nr:V-type ATP synthase subunit E [Deltaproteobacteria bacterium]
MSDEQMENKLIDKTIEQRNKMLDKANAEAASIESRTEAELKRIKDQTNQAIENILGGEIRAVHDRVVGGAQLQGRKLVMEARTEVIAKVFEDAQDAVMKVIKGSKYNDVLVNLASESITKIDEDCIVYANKADAKYLKSVMENLPLGHKVKVEESKEDILGGITVVNMDGTKTIYNTLETRLKAARGRLTSEVAEKLGVI